MVHVCGFINNDDPVYRYDVIYGSHGFASFGYKGGCAFANGTEEESLASPSAAQYLCGEEDFGFKCLHDHAGSGFCEDAETYDEYFLQNGGATEGFQTLQQACCYPFNSLMLACGSIYDRVQIQPPARPLSDTQSRAVTLY
jgi:hypothetical protein